MWQRGGSFLELSGLRHTLACYNEHLPFGPDDRTCLRANLVLHGVEALLDLAQSTAAGATSEDEMTLLQQLVRDVLETSTLLD